MSFSQFPVIGSTYMPLLDPPLTDSVVWRGLEDKDELTQLARIDAAASVQFDAYPAMSAAGSLSFHIPPEPDNEGKTEYDDRIYQAMTEAEDRDRFDASPAWPDSAGAGSSPTLMPPELGDEDSGSLELPPGNNTVQLSSSVNAPITPKRIAPYMQTAHKGRASFEPALCALAEILSKPKGGKSRPFHSEIEAWNQEYLADVDLNLTQCVACKRGDKTIHKTRTIGVALCEPCRTYLSKKKRKLIALAAQIEISPETPNEVVDTENSVKPAAKRPRLSQSFGGPASAGTSNQSHRLKGERRKLNKEEKDALNASIGLLIDIVLNQPSDQTERAEEWKNRPTPISPSKDVCQVCRKDTLERTAEIADNIFIQFCQPCYNLFHQRKFRARNALSTSTY